MLLHDISNKFATFLSAQLHISGDQIPIYAYGYELLFAAILNIVLIAIVSCLGGMPFAWLIFLLAFVPLRITAGGYHASTHLRCSAVFATAFAAVLVIAGYCPDTTKPVLNGCLWAINMVTTFIFSPVEAVVNPLCERVKKCNRKRSLSISLALALLIPIGFLPKCKQFTFIFYMGVLSASISQVAGKIQITKERRKIR